MNRTASILIPTGEDIHYARYAFAVLRLAPAQGAEPRFERSEEYGDLWTLAVAS